MESERIRQLIAEFNRIRDILETNDRMTDTTATYLARRAQEIVAEIESLAESRGSIYASPFVEEVRTMDMDTGRSSSSRTGTEYKTVSIDWGKHFGKKTRHLKRYSQEEHKLLIMVQQMVMNFLEPHFEVGWELDGAYDQAAKIMWKENWLTGSETLDQVYVQLRRRR